MYCVIVLFFLVVFSEVKTQCYIDPDIAIHWSTFPGNSPFQEDSNQCLANYTIFNENHIDDTADKGVNCSRRDSTATDGTWTYETDGSVVDCSANTGEARCERGPGSVTLYFRFGCCGGPPWPNGNYTCCIEGECISIRVYQTDDFEDLYPSSGSAIVESCFIIPPSDVTVNPQQYIVQMITSGVPPIRLVSNIDCTNDCDGTTVGESYYTLIDLTEERYQYSVPVTWNADNNNSNHQYDCRAIFGHGQGGTFLGTTLRASITAASSVPAINKYEVVNATAIKILWSIAAYGDINGFVIKITTNELSTVTQQLTDGSAREFIYNGLLPERDYTVEVRGYYELLGPAGVTSVKLKAGISSINGSLVSVSNDLSTQQIEVNCYTFRAQHYQFTWSVDSVLISPDSSYQPVIGFELLDSADQTYRHYITLTGSFSTGNTISCTTNVNEEISTKDYMLQADSSPPTGLSATILSSTSLSVDWTPSSYVTGYIIWYTPNGQSQLLNGVETSNGILEGLTQGATYQINVHSYKDLPSVSSSKISVLLDVPLIASFIAQQLTPNSAMVSWNTLNSIIDNYTVSYTRLCDNMKGTMLIEDGAPNSATINNLYPGLYLFSITPVNILGKGIERTDSVTLEESGFPTGAPFLQPPVVINSTVIKLSWEELNCTQRNGVITGYSIQYNSEGCQQPNVLNVTEGTNSVLAGLIPYSLYYISVAAINNNGIGFYSQEYRTYTMDNVVSFLSAATSKNFVRLSWQTLMSSVNMNYTYEVAYFTRPQDEQCMDSPDTLPDGYISYVNITNSSIKVSDLEPGTCYVFGIRIHYSDVTGDWRTGIDKTLEISASCSSESMQSGDNGLLGGTISTSIITIILLALVIVQTIWILYTRRNFLQKLEEAKSDTYESVEYPAVYDTVDIKETKAADIEMQTSKRYTSEKATTSL